MGRLKFLFHSSLLMTIQPDGTPVARAFARECGPVAALAECLDGAQVDHVTARKMEVLAITPAGHARIAGISFCDRLALAVAEVRSLVLIVEDAAVSRRAFASCGAVDVVQSLRDVGALSEPAVRRAALSLLHRAGGPQVERDALISALRFR